MSDDDSFMLSCAHLLLSYNSLLAMIHLRRYVHCSRSLSMHCICMDPLCVSICVFLCILFCKHWQVVLTASSHHFQCLHYVCTSIRRYNTRLMTIDFPNCCPSIIDNCNPSCPVHDDFIVAITHTTTVNRLSFIYPSHRTPKKCHILFRKCKWLYKTKYFFFFFCESSVNRWKKSDCIL